MATFASLDKRMGRDVNQIHDFLWHPAWKGDGKRLLANLAKESAELDAFLRAGGNLRRHGERLARKAAAEKDRFGAALYELLYDAYHLTAATERLRTGDPKGAAEHAARVVESDSIGTCVALNSFPLVEEWEGGKIDFESYASRLADLLQAKGVSRAGQYKRMLLVARTFGKEWDASAPAGQQKLSARAAIEAAAWCAVAARAIRVEAVDGTPIVPVSDFAAIIEKIVARL